MPVALIDAWVSEVLPAQKVLILTYGCAAERPAELLHSEEHDGVLLAHIDKLDELRLPAGYRASIRAGRFSLWISPDCADSSTAMMPVAVTTRI